MMRSITRFLSQIIIRYIEKPVLNYQAHQFVPLTDLRASLQPGDVLLVEGNQRISTAIKYLTQSTWPHAAVYIGEDHALKDEFGLGIGAEVRLDVEVLFGLGLNLRLGYAYGFGSQGDHQFYFFLAPPP